MQLKPWRRYRPSESNSAAVALSPTGADRSRYSSRTRKIVTDLGLFAASQVVFYFAFKVRATIRLYETPALIPLQVIMSSMDPQSSKRKEAKSKSKKALGKLGLDLSTLDLSEHEEIIAGEVVHADEIGVLFKGVLTLTRHPVPGTR